MKHEMSWIALAAAALTAAGCAPEDGGQQSAERPADNRIAPAPVAPPTTPATPTPPPSVPQSSAASIFARADLSPVGDAMARGTIEFHETGTGLLSIDVMLTGLDAGPHGLHVHDGSSCMEPGEHFNPEGTPHGAPTAAAAERHRGDLGNVTADDTGMVHQPVRDSLLAEDRSFIGKPIVVHRGQDDLASQPGGDSGDPIACGIIESVDEDVVSQAPGIDRGV
jgi:Cu-Zn family superoxide dismutase